MDLQAQQVLEAFNNATDARELVGTPPEVGQVQEMLANMLEKAADVGMAL